MVSSQVKDGYKKTEIGLLPSEWEVNYFKDICSIVNGQVDPTTEPYSDMPHIGNANIEKHTGRLLPYKTAKEERQTSGKYLFDKSHVLYGKINPQFGKVAYPEFEGICSADIYPISSEKFIPKFLKFLMLEPRFISYTTSVSGRTGIPKVNRKDLDVYRLVVPPYNEQNKIATILASVDEAIDKTESIIEQTEKVKKGLMQQLLTKGIGHIKFKKTRIGEIPEEWNIHLLKDISTKITDGAHHTPNYTESGVPFLRVTDLKNEKIDFTKTKYISQEEHEKLIKRCHPEKGDILLSKNGTIGLTKVIDWDEPFSIFVSLCLIKLNKDVVDPKYIEYFIQSEVAWKQIRIRSKQGTVTNLHLVEIKELLCGIPTIEEQKQIVEMIRPVNDKLLNESQRLNQLIKIKKGLMQVLLTGKVRVKVDE